MKRKILTLLLSTVMTVMMFSSSVLAASAGYVTLGVSNVATTPNSANTVKMNSNTVVIQTSNMDVGTHAVLLPNGVVFDYGFYALQYPDVSTTFGTSYEALLNHYSTIGIVEGRYPNAMSALNGQIVKGFPLNIVLMPNGVVFDANYYAVMYPDAYATCGFDKVKLYKHYIKTGAKQGRHPNAYTL